MKGLLFALVLGFSHGVMAGSSMDYQGEGKLKVKVQGPAGEVSQVEEHCTVSVGIDKTEKRLHVRKPSYDCVSLKPWVDESYDFLIKDGRLIDKEGVERGTFNETTGAMDFSYSQMKLKTVVESVLDRECKESSKLVRTVSLEKTQKFMLTPVSEKSWSLERSYYEEELVFRWRTNSECNGGYIAEKKKTSALLNAQVEEYN